jgi:hypothetical protein
MKLLRAYLSTMGLVLSVGGAIGSSFITQDTVYRWIDYPGTEDDMCVAIRLEDCNETGLFPCRCILGPAFRNRPIVATQCGQELYRDTPPNCQ